LNISHALPRMATRITFVAILFNLTFPTVEAADYSAVGHERQTIYRSPFRPAFTSWVGAWLMPDGSVMTSFTQATGPVENREKAPAEIRRKLNWPPADGEEFEQYDMTGLELRNVHLRSHDAGRTWEKVSADRFKSCMNGVSGEAETSLPDGMIVRGLLGLYLPFNPELPQTGFLQRSKDGSKSWGSPEVPLDPLKYTSWPRRLRLLRDGRLVLLIGMVPLPSSELTRVEFSKRVIPTILVSSDSGASWSEPIRAVGAEENEGWTEEFDIAELENGDLLAIFRPANGTNRRIGILRKADNSWTASPTQATVLPHNGQPELLASREGPILHFAPYGIHWTDDKGATWHRLDVPGTGYYPRSIQTDEGEILAIGHIGGDDGYDKADQSVVLDRFRLQRK